MPTCRRKPTPLVRFMAAVLLVVGALASPALAGPSTDDARVLRAEAMAALNAGDRDTAVKYLTGAARLAPDPGLWTMVGDMHASLDRFGAAADAWEAALALAPADPGVLERLSRSSAAAGDWQRATDAQARLVSALETRAKADPDGLHRELFAGETLPVRASHRMHLARLSTLAVLAGDFTTAEQAARALVASDRRALDGHLALGYVFLQARELDEAAEAYAEVLALDPHNTVALNNLGTIDYMGRDLKGAGARFEAVLGSDARTPYAESVALANLGELHQLRARYDDAEYLYGQAIEAFPHGAWSYMGRAALLDLTGRYDEAIDAMIDGWERDGNRLTRLNMHFYEPEWAWQRDALIAEIEGQWEHAARLWIRVSEGDVPALRRSAEHHLHSIELMFGK